MIPTVIAAFALMAMPQGTAPTALSHSFLKGEKLGYQVKSTLNAEQRAGNLETWIPADLDIGYNFTMLVQELKPDGIAQVLYERPTMTITDGETFSSPPKTHIEKTDIKISVTLSPINELLEIKDLNPTKKKPKKPTSDEWRGESVSAQASGFGNYISELQRLALFIGSLDSSLDFSPKLPLDAVKVGDTWKRTVGYSPQKLQGKEGKQAVQRLDYVYTYKGLMQSEGRQVRRIEAKLALDSDLGAFINQVLDMKPEDSGLKKVPMKLDATILFDLDAKTGRTIAAFATSAGSFQIFTTEGPADEALVEQRFKGRTTLHLTGFVLEKNVSVK